MQEAALVAAIEAAPDEEAAQLVYMDWLLERGDPRGQLIRMQIAQLRDEDWALPRYARRGRAARYVALSRLFDRGRPGFAIDLVREKGLDKLGVRWLKPAISSTRSTDTDAAVAAFRASSLLPQLDLLDLSEWKDPSWRQILDCAARPRHLVMPPDAGNEIAAWRDAPLCARVERLDLRGTCNAAMFETLLAAPWIANLVDVSLSTRAFDEYWWMSRWTDSISDAGLARLVERAPHLRTLDARYHPVTAAGLHALATSSLQSLRLTADDLDAEAFAVLANSRLAGITRVSLAGRWLTSVDPVLQLVRSPCWDGRLDFLKMLPLDDVSQFDRVAEILRALATTEPTRPLRTLVFGRVDNFAQFAASPFARTLQHLTGGFLGDSLGETALPLVSVRLHDPRSAIANRYLAAPMVQGVRQLALESATAHAVRALASSALRPEDIQIKGGSNTEATSALVRSPVVERVVDLSLEVDGNHNAKVVTAALVDTPYLRDVQYMDLDFVEKFAEGQHAALRRRYGAAYAGQRK